MKKDRVATIITVGILAAACAFAIFGRMGVRIPGIPRAEPPRQATPQDAIYGMLDAARAGDTKAYLSEYAGKMRADLERAVAEKTEAGFKNYLQSQNAEIKGVAVGEPTPISDNEVEIRVEYIYQDRNEAQTMYLQKGASDWKITRIDSSERVQTLVPYGTPVQ